MGAIEIKQRFIEMRAQGYSFDRIAKELGKAKQTLLDWSKELQEEIANYKAIELEALQEKYFLLKQHRITLLGDSLLKIKGELDKRDLSEVDTFKLLELFSKYYLLLRDEYIEPIFKSSEEVAEDKEERELLEGLIAQGSKEIKLKAV